MGWCESFPLPALTVPSHQFHGLHPLHTCRYVFGHLKIYIYTPVGLGTCRYIFSGLVNLVAQMEFFVQVFFTPVKGVLWLWLWATHSHYYGLNFACLVCASWAFSLCPCLFLGHFVFAGRVIIPSSLWSIESTVSSSSGHCAPLSKIVKKCQNCWKL